LLIGNKYDKHEHRIITEEGEKLAKELNMKYIEASAKDDNNINEAFNYLFNKIIKRIFQNLEIFLKNMNILKPRIIKRKK